MLRESLDREHPLSSSYNMATPPDIAEDYHDPLDDVFGAGSETAQRDTDGENGSTTQSRIEQSEIPRLRSVHVTNGYRDGISESKATFVQAGFDEGYSLGAMLGFRSAWLIAFHESISRLSSTSDLQTSLQEARTDLALQSIFSSNFFTEDGIWSYSVPGSENEQDFDVVSRAHPLIQKWSTRIEDMAGAAGLEMELFSTKYED